MAEVRVTSGGDPTDEEVAAIVAAVEVAWPDGGRPPRPRAVAALAVLGPVVVQAGPAAPRPSLVGR